MAVGILSSLDLTRIDSQFDVYRLRIDGYFENDTVNFELLDLILLVTIPFSI